MYIIYSISYTVFARMLTELLAVLIEEWSDWSACSETCGDGVRQRSYTCQNAPEQLGIIPECMGDGKVHEEQICSNDPCPNNRKLNRDI